MPTDAFITANGLRLHFVDFGGEGRPILAIHGIASGGWSWQDVASGLGDEARVIAPDLRGHADSQWAPDGSYGSAEAAADLADLVTVLGLGELDVIGHSWGGLIAIALTELLGNQVRRLAIVDIAPSSTVPPDQVAARQVEFESWDAALDAERKRAARATDAAVERLTDRTHRPSAGGAYVKKMDPVLLARWDFRAEDHWPALGRIRQPTLVVKAAGSGTLPEEVAEQMASTLHDGRWVTIPETGHAVHVENPDGLLDALRPFLAG